MPKISIIIATLNGEQTLRKAIESVQHQTMNDFEIIVVDDGSTDGTYSLVSSMAASDARLRCVRMEKNVGVAAARNAGLDSCTGEWIAILDADDWYKPQRLERLLAEAETRQADFVADNLLVFDHARGEVVDRTRFGPPNVVMPLSARFYFDGDTPLTRYPMGLMQPLMRRQFLEDHSIRYDSTHRIGEDFLIVADMLMQGARAFIVPEAAYVYVHRISPTTRKISSQSHSGDTGVFTMIARGCNEVMSRYSQIAPDALQALERRKRLFERANEYQKARQAMREKRLVAALRLAISEPIIAVMAMQIIMGVVGANARCFLGLHRRFG